MEFTPRAKGCLRTWPTLDGEGVAFEAEVGAPFGSDLEAFRLEKILAARRAIGQGRYDVGPAMDETLDKLADDLDLR
jgi:hypothetical protein